MKILLIGKSASITHWLEDAGEAFRALGHEVRMGFVRRPWLNAALEKALAEPLSARLAARAARFAPNLILAVGGFHVPPLFLERLAALPGRPPIAGWVGDLFDEDARAMAALYDLTAYTDTGLLARHHDLGFPGRAIFLPHAAKLAAPPAAARAERMVFVATRTPGREAVVEALTAPITVRGPGWRASVGGGRHRVGGRAKSREAQRLYASHIAALNVRNEFNVLGGLNQRSFDPCLSATAVVSDDQGDLGLCFEPGREVLAWRDVEALNEIHARLLRDPAEAARIGEAGRRRVLAHHTYERRLETLRAAL